MRQVIYAWNYQKWGGAQIYFFSIIREAARFFKIKVLIPAQSPARVFEYLEKLDVAYEFLPEQPEINKTAAVIKKIETHQKKLAAENRLVKFILAQPEIEKSIVHIDLGFWQSFLPLFRLARRTNVVTTVHTALPYVSRLSDFRWKTKGNILDLQKNFNLLTSNKDARKSLTPYFREDKMREVKVAYSGFNEAEIAAVNNHPVSRGEIIKRCRLPENKFFVVTVGQFIERKGAWRILEALQILRETEPEVYFLWLGTEEPDAATRRKIAEYNVETNFRLLSAAEIGATRSELLNLFNIADIFILASLEEGLPVALIEAMALGKPCVATAVNAIPEAIINRENGILIEPDNAVEIVRAITHLKENKKLRAEFAAAAKATAFEKFNEKRAAEVTIALYKQIFNEKT